jgi:membrane protease YdiL (CAAX protease family)
VNTFQVLEALKHPINADRNLIILISLFYTLFSFFIIPIAYLFFYKKDTVRFLWTNRKIRFTPLVLSTITVFTIIPFITILVRLNYSIEFPTWLSELEGYFKKGEENAQQLTSFLLSFSESKDIIIAIFIMAIIPGILEELFFRGIVQIQLQSILQNGHLAILLGAFLFSFFHFQFYGFIPRLIFGVLLGYIFLWSNNIWYSCAAHVTNNLMGVLGSYFFGPPFFNPENRDIVSIVLLIPSVAITVLIILRLRRIESTKILTEDKLTI